jgi:sugar lactone lactonase YvrE
MTQLPDLFGSVPIALVPSHTIVEFPINTFLESIVIASDNIFYITSHNEGKIIRMDSGGTSSTHTTIEGKATGLVMAPDGGLLLSGWDAQNTAVIWKINVDGTAHVLVTLPDAIFLNGITPLNDQLYLIADSYRGAIWKLDLAQASVQIWLEHPLLARANLENPTPAINGLKIFDRVLYASVTQNAQIIQIPIQSNDQPGEPEVFIQNVNIDDFAFDLSGNLYGTTHIYNSVVKITPDRKVTTIAQAEQGMAGSTALAFGRVESDRTSIYVITNGGMSLPLPTGIEPAKVIRLEVGFEGLPLI